MTPTIARREAFLQVAAAGSFSRGAFAAGVGQSTLSRTVQALGQALGLVARPLAAPVMRRPIGVVTRSGRPLPVAATALLAAIGTEFRAVQVISLRDAPDHPASGPTGRSDGRP